MFVRRPQIPQPGDHPPPSDYAHKIRIAGHTSSATA
jgi:hypothetical protein